MRPAVALCYDFNRCLVRYRILIRSGAPECVVLAAKNTDASFNRDCFTLPAQGYPVPSDTGWRPDIDNDSIKTNFPDTLQ